METTYITEAGSVVYAVTKNEDGDFVDRAGNPVTDAKGNMRLYEDGLALCNVRVIYTDASGYVSIIQTDIRVRIPDMEFAQAVSLPSLTSFSLIAQGNIGTYADAGLISANTVRGSFYARRLVVGNETQAANVTLKLEEDEQKYNADKRMVVAEDIYVGRGAKLWTDEYGELWSTSISMHGKGESGNASEVSFLGNDVYVADDLLLEGEGNIFTAGKEIDGKYCGKYIGFGNGSKPEESSAVIVNGTQAELYLDKLTNLTLAGNAYIGLKDADDRLDPQDTVQNHGTEDIVMGQSIAVKSDQVAYLVPAECIGVSTETGKTVLTHSTNPITLEEYNASVKDKEGIQEVGLHIPCQALGGKTLSDYGIKEYMYRKYFKRVNSKITLVYFYVNFDSGNTDSLKMANEYFADFYHVNKATLDAYASLYTDHIQIRNASEGFYTLHLSGNVVRSDAADSRQLQEASLAFDAGNTGYQGLLSANQFKYRALCKKMIDVYEQLTPSEKEAAANVYTNLVRLNAIDDYWSDVYADVNIVEKGAEIYFGENEDKAVIVQGDYEYTGADSFSGLIIATGNVTVSHDFKGTIIAGGNIVLGQNRSVEPDRESVLRVLTYTKTINGKKYHVTDFLKGGEGYLRDENKTYLNSDINLGELIVYENWQKQ